MNSSCFLRNAEAQELYGSWEREQKSFPLTWAERLKRVFDIDISVCPLCGGRVRVIADATDPDVTVDVDTSEECVVCTLAGDASFVENGAFRCDLTKLAIEPDEAIAVVGGHRVEKSTVGLRVILLNQTPGGVRNDGLVRDLAELADHITYLG